MNNFSPLSNWLILVTYSCFIDCWLARAPKTFRRNRCSRTKGWRVGELLHLLLASDPVAPVNPFLHLPECQLVLIMGHSPTRALTFKTQDSWFCMFWFWANKSRRPMGPLNEVPPYSLFPRICPTIFHESSITFLQSSNSCDCPTPFIHFLPETGRPFQPKCKVYNTVMKVVFITATCCWRSFTNGSQIWSRNFWITVWNATIIVIIGKPVWRCTS